MELRILLGAIRRAAVLVVAAGVVGLLLGASMRPDAASGRAAATIALDPEGGRGPQAPAFSGDPDRYVEDELSVIRSQALAEAAASELRGVSGQDVEDAVTVTQRPGSSIVDIEARAGSPARAVTIAQAVAQTYLRVHQQQRDAGLAEHIRQTDADLQALLEDLAEVQGRIDAATRAAAADDDDDVAVTPEAADVVAKEALLRQYDQALNRRSALIAAAESVADRTAIIQPAVARAHDDPGALGSAFVGAFAGLFVGVGGALIWNAAAPRILDRHHAEEVVGQPASAVVRVGRIDSTDHLGTRARQHLRRAATLLTVDATSEPPLVIGVCAPASRRTSGPLAAGLTEAFAREGLRTAHAALGSGVAPWEPAGPAEPLAADHGALARWERTPTAHPGIDVVTRNPGDTTPLDGARVRELRKLLEPRADVVVVELPPLLESVAGAASSQELDALALVVTVRHETERDLELARQLVASCDARVHLLVAHPRAALVR